MTFSEALSLLEDDIDFQKFMTRTLKTCGYKAYVWECIPISSTTVTQTPFKFAVTESISLDRTSCDKYTFSEHFEKSKNPYVVGFFNLGRDAYMVSPMPLKSRDYSHLGKFLQNADENQTDALFPTKIQRSNVVRFILSDFFIFAIPN